MRTLVARSIYWKERQRTLFLQLGTFLSIVAGESYQAVRFLGG